MNDAVSAAPVVAAGSVKFGNDLPISIIAGPCQLESRAHALEVLALEVELRAELGFGRARGENGRAVRMACDPRRGGDDVVVARQCEGHAFPGAAQAQAVVRRMVDLLVIDAAGRLPRARASAQFRTGRSPPLRRS